MPFDFKNSREIYKRLMDTVFSNNISQNLEVYIEDMVIKTPNKGWHEEYLKELLTSVIRFNMQLNLNKCSFGFRLNVF